MHLSLTDQMLWKIIYNNTLPGYTDNLVHYTGVVLEYGEVPNPASAGWSDLIARLPRDQSPKPLILLLQLDDCYIVNGHPPYFSQSAYLETPFLETRLEQLFDLEDATKSPIPEVDYPNGRLHGGFSCRNI
ncbi:hypothetical protein BGW37DRAFT_518939 [Umbelopsis sp. PMI_123]|nr:hypothetical protein BGW37DRAFT_518939 [Umbelopsis sp. PMI_123]